MSDELLKVVPEVRLELAYVISRMVKSLSINEIQRKTCQNDPTLCNSMRNFRPDGRVCAGFGRCQGKPRFSNQSKSLQEKAISGALARPRYSKKNRDATARHLDPHPVAYKAGFDTPTESGPLPIDTLQVRCRLPYIALRHLWTIRRRLASLVFK